MHHKTSNILAVGICLLLLTLASSSVANNAVAGRGLSPDALDIGESLERKGPTLHEGSSTMTSTSRFTFQGVDYTQHAPFGHPESDLSLEMVASMGANWIGVRVHVCQESLNATTVFNCPYTPSDADFIHLINKAHNLGLKVMLKMNPEAGPDLGSEFDDAAWAAWFTSYRQLVYHYAEFAQVNGVDMFVVGNEMHYAVPQEAQWRQTIAGVRARYHGPITYSSLCYGQELENNWWDALDYIGINFFRAITDKDDPTLAELKEGWQPHVAEYADLAARWGKKIVFTEIGFCSRDGGNHDCELIPDPQLDIQEQTISFQAAFESLDGQPWFAGMFWHQWGSDPFHAGPCDDFYYFHDKPAEDVVRAWFGGSPRFEPEPDYGTSAAIYTDELAPGWEDGAWSATYNLAATDQVFTGTRSISVTLEPWGGIQFRYPSFDTSPYYFLEFHMRSPVPGGQQLMVTFDQEGPGQRVRPLDDDGRYTEGCAIEPEKWERVRIPLWHLGSEDKPITALNIFYGSDQGAASFWLDEIRLVGRVQRAGCLPRYGEPEFVLTVNESSPLGYEPFLTAGDFNGDGLKDVVITKMTFQTTETYELDILLNNGNGSLLLATSSIFSGTVPVVQHPRKVIIADFNGDGHDDIFVADHGYDDDPYPGYQNTLVLSTADGKLINATSNLPQQSDYTHSASAADIDGDGDIDLYLGELEGQQVINPQILLNNGQGQFTIAEGRLHQSLDLTQNGYTASEFVDVNNDGLPDLVLGEEGRTSGGEFTSPRSVVLLNDGQGNFMSAPIALPKKPSAAWGPGLDIQPMDLNGDGYQDLLITYTKRDPWYVGRYIQVLINNLDGSFRDETAARLPQADNNDPWIRRLVPMDIDRDGDMDLLARPWDDRNPNPLVFLNDGAGRFRRQAFDFRLWSLYHAFLDLDGDGGRDLVLASAAPPEDIYVIRELGCPLFLPLVLRRYSASADLIFHNGRLLTMEGTSWDAQAIAIRGDRILAVGSDVEVLALRGPQTQVIDLHGLTLMPGFVDAHTHIFNDAWYWEMNMEGTQQLALQNGITTLANMYTPPEFLEEMRTFEEESKLIIRTSLYLIYDDACGNVIGDWYLQYPPTRGFGERLRIGGVKIFSDGGACGMPAVSFDYPEDWGGGQGDLWLSQTELNQAVAQAHTAGYQVAIHAVGDRAVEAAQNAIEFALAGQPNTLRHRIEHNTIVRPELRSRYGQIGIIPAIFGWPPTCAELAGEGWGHAVGPERLSWVRNYRALLDANPGLHVTWHGDDPWVGPISPILELYGLVTRKEIAEDGTICEPPDWLAATALTVEEALPMMTIEAAYALFRENEVGSLKPGKLADLIVLSDNPLTVAPDDIKDIELLMTMVGGHVEYCAAGQEALCPGR